MSSLPPEYDAFLRRGADEGDSEQPADDPPTSAEQADSTIPSPRAIPVIPAPGSQGVPDPTTVAPVIPAPGAPAAGFAAAAGAQPRIPAPTPPSPPPPGAPVPAPPTPQPAQPILPPPRPTTTSPKRRRRRGWRIVRWLVLAFVLYLISLAAVFLLAVNRIDALPATPAVTSSGMNVLIVGSDSRAGLTEEQRNQLSTGLVEGDRTDTIMLLHIPTFGSPTLVSIPRDSWVSIPGHGEDKINAAYALGGPQLLITTVEQTTGLQITDFMEVGFAGIANVTDALGGVRLCPAQDYNDELSGLNVSAGCQTMDGATALAYVRMRYADPKGDLGRVLRQQEYVSAVTKRAISPLTLLLPWRSYPTAHAAGSALTVGNNTGVFDLGRIGVAMAMLSFGWGTQTTVPVADDNLQVDGQSAVQWDSAQAFTLFAGLR